MLHQRRDPLRLSSTKSQLHPVVSRIPHSLTGAERQGAPRGGGEQLALPRPGDQVGVTVQVLAGIDAPLTADRVGKVEAGLPADELEPVLLAAHHLHHATPKEPLDRLDSADVYNRQLPL